jgi:flavin-dependent dehydrogenase
MSETHRNDDQYTLEEGANIAVIGGGPTGSFFSIFALKMAKMVGKELHVTIFEPKDFSKDGPKGCNHCGGVISELLVQMLAVEGINLPDSVVQKGINSYRLHTHLGSVFIATPSYEKTIATIYRGGGPRGIVGKEKESFDNFLLHMAIQEGAVHNPVRIDQIEYKYKKPILFSQDHKIQEADLVVGAFGVNSTTAKVFENMGFGYKKPSTVRAAIAEVALEKSFISEFFGDSIHLFLLPVKDIKFAAMIPKDTYITLCIMGKNLTAEGIKDFLDHSVVKGVLPEKTKYGLNCRCLPNMNVLAPQKPFADRVVICGDAGSTRLFKDGIGAAYIMGKAAARTAVFQGVSARHFNKYYYPVYKRIIIDNYYGRFLFAVTDLYKKYKCLCEGMLEVVRKEQWDRERQRILSSILWDVFTGNEQYRNIFFRSFNVRMQLDLMESITKILARSVYERR